mgnify:CR=1 FL=1
MRLVYWFVLFAWSGLGAAFAPLVLLALTRGRVNRHGALAAMLTGAGVTIAWKLGRDAATNPEMFARVWWVTLVAGAAILIVGEASRAFTVADKLATVAATGLTVLSWWLVQHWGLSNLYELVPAFCAAGFAALAPLPPAGTPALSDIAFLSGPLAAEDELARPAPVGDHGNHPAGTQRQRYSQQRGFDKGPGSFAAKVIFDERGRKPYRDQPRNKKTEQ